MQPSKTTLALGHLKIKGEFVPRVYFPGPIAFHLRNPQVAAGGLEPTKY
jgi:hypothetical protein